MLYGIALFFSIVGRYRLLEPRRTKRKTSGVWGLVPGCEGSKRADERVVISHNFTIRTISNPFAPITLYIYRVYSNDAISNIWFIEIIKYASE